MGNGFLIPALPPISEVIVELLVWVTCMIMVPIYKLGRELFVVGECPETQESSVSFML